MRWMHSLCGFPLGARRDEADRVLHAELCVRTLETPLTTESLILALRPTLAAKQYGSEDLLAKLVAEAVLAVMPKDPKNVRVVPLPPTPLTLWKRLTSNDLNSSTWITSEWSRLWVEDSTRVVSSAGWSLGVRRRVRVSLSATRCWAAAERLGFI